MDSKHQHNSWIGNMSAVSVLILGYYRNVRKEAITVYKMLTFIQSVKVNISAY